MIAFFLIVNILDSFVGELQGAVDKLLVYEWFYIF